MNHLGPFLLIALIILAGCQSAPTVTTAPEQAIEAPAEAAADPPPVTAAPSSIVVGRSGFSPLAQSPANVLSFSLRFGETDSVTSWRVDMANEAGMLVRSVRGVAPSLPPTLTWDGKDDSGQLAPEGNYKARLSIERTGTTLEVESEVFLLDITPPSGSITVAPQPWEPGDPDLIVNPPSLSLTVNLVEGVAPIASWRLGVFHPDGRRFIDFINEDNKDNTIVWTGRAANNATLEPGITYDLVAQVFDRYGNQGTLKGALVVAQAPPPEPSAPVTVTLDGQLIASTKVFFPAYSADLSQVIAVRRATNEQALDTLADALRAAQGSKIRVVGHANKVFWQDEAKGAREQELVLIPLSLARAEAVRDALVARGLEPTQFDLTGVGAEGALVPFGDLLNNWKNRRVEFLISQDGDR